LKVEISLNSISVKKKDNSKTFISGEWPEKIDLDDTTWTLVTENGEKIMEILVTKFHTDM